MGLGATTLKHILLLLNFVFVVLGLVLFGFGIFLLVSAPDHKTVVHGEETTVDIGEKLAAGLVIALGVIIVIISFVGCLAVIHEARRRLICYVALLAILVMVQMIMSGMASQGTQDGLAGSVHRGFESLWAEELKEPGALCYYERWLHCCGVNGTEDYQLINHPIPKTCCLDENCHEDGNLFQEGCEEKFNDYLASKMLAFNIINGLLIVGEIVAAVLGFLLYNTLKNENRRSNMSWM